MEICYLAGPAAFEEFGAVRRHVLGLVNALGARGHVVTLFAPRPADGTRPAVHPSVRVVSLRAPRTGVRWLDSVVFHLLLPVRAWREFRRLRPDVVYSRMSYLDVLAIAPLKACFDFRYVAEVNGIASLESRRSKPVRRLVGLMEGLTLRRSDLVIAVTPELRAWALGVRGVQAARTAVVGNGVDCALFRPMPREEACGILGLDRERRYLCFVGGLRPWHDLTTALDALARLLERRRDLALVVVGDGPQCESLQRAAARRGVDGHVVWAGATAPDRVPLYVNAADVCLAPFSRAQRDATGVSPLKVFEYMACARPFVASRVGDDSAREMAAWGCGVLVPPADAPALMRAVLRLLEDGAMARRLGERGRRLALADHDWSRVAARVEALLGGAET